MRTAALLRLACLAGAASLLSACTQDEASSNPNDRETHMGDIHAATPPPPASTAPAAPLAAPAPSASH
jgi:hypothetical protein